MFFFPQRARLKLSDLSSSLSELGKLSNAVAEFFCEDPAIFKLEDCCSVFNFFCQKFLTSIQVSLHSLSKGGVLGDGCGRSTIVHPTVLMFDVLLFSGTWPFI